LTQHGWTQEGSTLLCSAEEIAIAAPVPGGTLSLVQQAKIYQRAAAGERLVDLAREHGVYYGTIWRIVHKTRRDLRRLLEQEEEDHA
jgi:hypothetical protein